MVVLTKIWCGGPVGNAFCSAQNFPQRGTRHLMKKQFITITFISAICSGCSFFNPLLTGVAFKEYADDAIGRNIGEYTDVKSRRSLSVIPIDKGSTEYQLEHVYKSSQSGRTYTCIWAVIVKNSSEKIVSWRYISDPKKCKSRYFYEGAW